MANRQHIIELNGKKYDALTGKMVDSSAHASPSPKSQKSAPTMKPIDGFMHSSKRTSASVAARKVHQAPSRSKTLMRKSVKKPVPLKTTVKRTSQTHTPPKAQNLIKTSAPIETIRPERASRASFIQKSSFISKFGRSMSGTVKTDEVPVAPAPPAAVAAAANLSLKHHVSKANPFDTALEKATSHEQPRAKKIRLHHKIAQRLHIAPRTVLLVIAGFFAVLTGGILTYHNVPNVAMRVAAARAGVQANLPSYQPAGFSLKGPIEYAPGEIQLNYRSNSDDRGFKVVQRTSDWNSETLLDNFISSSKKSYQTFQANGRNIYIYDGSNATWVDGGTWYKIEGHASLNSDQLLRMANSL